MPRENKKRSNKQLIPKANVPKHLKANISIFPNRSQEEVIKLNKEKIHFSFKLLDIKHKAFNCGGVEPPWFLQCFENLKAISDLTFNEFEAQRQHFELHRHDFEKTTHHYNESVAPEILEQLSPENMIQFRLSSSAGRVHGIRYHNTIYVVWLDPYHNMNWDSRFGPPKHYDAPITPYEILQQFNASLENIIKEKNEEIETLEEMLAECQEKNA